MFIMGSDLNIIAPFLADISRTYRVSVATSGWLVTVFAGGYAMASPIAGYLSDRTGRRFSLMVGMGSFVLFETASGLAPSFGMELAARLMAGASAGAVSPAAYALVADVVPKSQRAGIMSILSMGFSVSTVAGVPLGLWLATAIGWRGTLLAIGAGLALAAYGLMVALKGKIVSARTTSISPEEAHLSSLILDTWPSLLASFMAFVAIGLVYTYLPTALIQQGLPHPGGLLAVLSGYGLMNLAGNAIFGRMGDRKGMVRTIHWAQGMELVSLMGLAISVIFSELAWMVAASWGFALTQAYIPDLKAMAANVARDRRGASLAFNNTAMYSGMMTGSALGAGLFHSGSFVLIVFSAVAAVGIGLGGMLRRTVKTEHSGGVGSR